MVTSQRARVAWPKVPTTMSLKNNRSFTSRSRIAGFFVPALVALGACSGPSSKGGSSASNSAASGSAPKSVRAADKQAPERDQLYRELERISKGEPVDQPLRRPKLRVTTAGVEVNGERLEDVALSSKEVSNRRSRAGSGSTVST